MRSLPPVMFFRVCASGCGEHLCGPVVLVRLVIVQEHNAIRLEPAKHKT